MSTTVTPILRKMFGHVDEFINLFVRMFEVHSVIERDSQSSILLFYISKENIFRNFSISVIEEYFSNLLSPTKNQFIPTVEFILIENHYWIVSFLIT